MHDKMKQQDFDDEFNQVILFENWRKQAYQELKEAEDRMIKDFLNPIPSHVLDICAHCGNDEGIERNRGYKINICEECWKK